MEINRADLRIGESSSDLIPVYVKPEDQERDSESSDAEVITEANHFCAIEIKESNNNSRGSTIREEITTCDFSGLSSLDSSISNEQQTDVTALTSVLSDPINLRALDSDFISEELQRRMNQATEVFVDGEDHIHTSNYSIPTVTIPNEFLEGLNLNIKREGIGNETTYTAEWLCEANEDPGLRLKISKGGKQHRLDASGTDPHSTIAPLAKRKGILRVSCVESYKGNESKLNGTEKPKRRARIKAKPRQDYRERLRRKAECMREKRKKLSEEESEEQRLQRLAKEAAKRREMRMYYETPEQRRKRLDTEAARKREYRMYNETPEERRKRLDREAERRRFKRMTLYASETPEQRRERLDRESAKRREARLNQYAKETEEQRRERLRRDAQRAQEMRFTRSAIETEEERRQSFEELNNVQMRDDPDNQLGSHYLSNWMMWFQNTLTQPIHIGEQTIEPQSQNNG
ncbi:stress response protein NST1 isoform X2 [Cephus cinctus]|uniref:Stress response protein NST1 isoform X2 n=1 Tax=Cephus cinctus TaxID=211228 RepID=A0AAJ7CBV5_CEPCN|nr:stress response protein NST1 isoform X2 [Cephus cinctus]